MFDRGLILGVYCKALLLQVNVIISSLLMMKAMEE